MATIRVIEAFTVDYGQNGATARVRYLNGDHLVTDEQLARLRTEGHVPARAELLTSKDKPKGRRAPARRNMPDAADRAGIITKG